MKIPKDSVLYKLMAWSGVQLINGFEYFIVKTRGNKTFYEPADFPWIKTVEDSCPIIQKELYDLLATQRESIPEFKDISPEQGRITQGEWRTFVFYAYGVKSEFNAQACPETTKVLESIPGMTTGMFSILAPGARLTPHRGPFKGVLRYHLALIIPSNAESCGIRVGSDQGYRILFGRRNKMTVPKSSTNYLRGESR